MGGPGTILGCKMNGTSVHAPRAGTRLTVYRALQVAQVAHKNEDISESVCSFDSGSIFPVIISVSVSSKSENFRFLEMIQQIPFAHVLGRKFSISIIAVIIPLLISSKSDIVSFSRIFDDNYEFLLKKGSTSHPAR